MVEGSKRINVRLHNKFPVKAKYFRTLKYRKLQRTFMRLYSEAAWPVKNDLTMWREHLKNGKDGLDDSFVPMTAPDVSALPPA